MPQDEPLKRRLRDKLLLRDRSRSHRPESPTEVDRSCQGQNIIDVEPGFVQPVTTDTLNEKQTDVVKVQAGPGDKTALSIGVQEDSLWAHAYKRLQKQQPDLIETFNTHLGLNTIDIDNQSLNRSKVDTIAEDALASIEKLNDSKRDTGTFTDTIRKHFERIIKMIIASKDFISSAASLNPYAALAWTGVSMLLPVRVFPVASVCH